MHLFGHIPVANISLTCVQVWFTVKACFHWWLFWPDHNAEAGKFRDNIDYNTERPYRQYTYHGLGLRQAAPFFRQFWSECYCVGHRRSARNSIWTSRTSVNSFIVWLIISFLCNRLQVHSLKLILFYTWHHTTSILICLHSKIVSSLTLYQNLFSDCWNIFGRFQNLLIWTCDKPRAYIIFFCICLLLLFILLFVRI